MPFKLNIKTHFILFTFLLFGMCYFTTTIQAQKHDADSMMLLLKTNIADTSRVNVYSDIGFAMYSYSPDSALQMAYNGLQLARKIKYTQGISNCLGTMATVLYIQGNYSKSLEYYIENLKIEEGLKSVYGVACVKNNIGIVYSLMNDYDNAILSYLFVDSLVKIYKYKSLGYSAALNLGDVYEKKENKDLAYSFYNTSLEIAQKQKNNDRIAKSTLALASIFYKQNKIELSLSNYRKALQYMLAITDEDLICETCLGICKVFNNLQQQDSVIVYSKLGLSYATKNNFAKRELELKSFLADYYAQRNNMDSAYNYLKASKKIEDDIHGADKLRNSEQITFNENLRQIEMGEKLLIEKEEKRQQMQMILIGILIPVLFFITILLSRIRIKIAVIKFLGIISLLFFFEYLTLLLHPRVVAFTHHTPIYEILIFVAIAAMLIPAHHKIEHWLIELLVKRLNNREEKTIASKEIKEQPLS